MWKIGDCDKTKGKDPKEIAKCLAESDSTCCESCRLHYLPYVKSLFSKPPFNTPSDDFISHLLDALCVLTAALKAYGPEKLALSFNGGKDCTVLLELLSRLIPISSLGLVAHFRAPPVFPTVDSFLLSSQSRYKFTLYECSARKSLPLSKPPLADCLDQMLSSYPNISAVLLGTRKTDFDSSPSLSPQQIANCCRAFAPTDTAYGWPPCMRVCPLSSWTHSDVWMFLRATETPTCSLYAEGFTSLGRADRSFPNQALYNCETRTYAPAWELKDDSLERCSRVRTPPPPSCYSPHPDVDVTKDKK